LHFLVLVSVTEEHPIRKKGVEEVKVRRFSFHSFSHHTVEKDVFKEEIDTRAAYFFSRLQTLDVLIRQRHISHHREKIR
jgi:hypothetical protein